MADPAPSQPKAPVSLERVTRLASEGLARRIDRRVFLKRAGQTAFATIAAVASGHMTIGQAAARGGTKPPEPVATPSCSPPGPYCNTGGGILSGCHGAHCFQHLYNGQVYQCRVYYQYYQAGCWTTSATGGYWTCCDCECLNDGGQRVATCGCAQFSGSPSPAPAAPGGKTQA
jgi:hypothetical protein